MQNWLYKLIAVLIAVQFFMPGISQATETNNTSPCEVSNAVAPTVTATVTDEGVLVKWEKINHTELVGYKVVISKDNPHPKYSEDGYLKWITDTNVTSYLVTGSEKYHNGDFGKYLEPGESYYFSVTAVYNCGYKLAGNAVLVKFPKDDDQPVISCEHYKLIKEDPTRDKYWEKLGLDTSKNSDIAKYRIKWSNGSWSEWFTPGENDIDWKDNCGDKYYLGGRDWDLSRPTECSRRVWSYFTDHVHEYYQCLEDGDVDVPGNNSWKEVKKETKKIKLDLKKDEELKNIRNKVKLLTDNKLDEILQELKELRSVVKEQQAQIKYLKGLTNKLQKITKKMQSAIQNFVAYGVDDNTKMLGEGERAAVIHSYEKAFGKLPESENDLEDAIKIANGRWPSQRSLQAEQRALEHFQRIYKRLPDYSNKSDEAAITIMSYGLRQKAENRNLHSEQRGIEIFKNIYGHLPQSTEDWNIMQAITYSGARR